MGTAPYDVFSKGSLALGVGWLGFAQKIMYFKSFIYDISHIISHSRNRQSPNYQRVVILMQNVIYFQIIKMISDTL